MAESLTVGSTFAGRYKIIRALKSGGMGAVYEAEHTATEKRVALKTMRPEIISNEEAQKRFAQESRVSALIDSRHVVAVTDAGVADGIPFLVMEYLRGQELGEALRANRAFTPAEVSNIVTQIARGLDKAHAAGVVHRDLKPDNVFLTRDEDGRRLVKILDFGIAKILQGVTTTTIAGGTPMFMAPEQTKRGQITPAADVWALGLIAFRLLGGRNFWDSELVGELYGEILEDKYAKASCRANVPLPNGFDEWFNQCVTKEPSHRFASAGLAARELAKVIGVVESLPAEELPPSVMRPAHTTSPLETSDKTVVATPLGLDPTDVVAAKEDSLPYGATHLAAGPSSVTMTQVVLARRRRSNIAMYTVGGLAVMGALASIAFLATRPRPPEPPATQMRSLSAGTTQASEEVSAVASVPVTVPVQTSSVVASVKSSSVVLSATATAVVRSPWAVVPLKNVLASRDLKTDQRAYPSNEVCDGDLNTAWGVRDVRPGEDWFEVKFAKPTPDKAAVTMTTGYFRPGVNLDPWSANAHLKRFRVVTDKGESTHDVREDQRRIVFRLEPTTRIRIIVDEVYAGTKWQDLLISEIEVHRGWGAATPTSATAQCEDKELLDSCTKQSFASCWNFPDEAAASKSACLSATGPSAGGSSPWAACCP